MKRPPPYLVRRLLWNPAFVVGVVLLFATIPLWLVVAAFASRIVPGRWRPLRVLWFLVIYLLFESLMLIVMFGLWIVSGFGWEIRSPRFQETHYRLAAWWLRNVIGSARHTFDLSFRRDDDVEGTDVRDPDAPMLVFSRHAGPGDSFLLVDAILNVAQHRPRIVLKDLLQLDPCVDVALNRLPSQFVPSTGRAGAAVVDAIAELSADMADGDALVLFPEGGNFTEHRRERAIEKLNEIGRPGLAEQARQMRHVLPPKPTGALAALAAAPHARVVFVGHVGLEEFATVRDLWRGIPMDSSIVTRLWHVAPEEVPPEPQREQWLYDHWKHMDDWIDATVNGGDVLGPDQPGVVS